MANPDPTAWEIVIVVGDQIEVRAIRGQASATVGRSTDNDIQVDHPSVSRHHAKLHFEPSLSVEDLGGANGTYVQERDPERPHGETENWLRLNRSITKIRAGDTIGVGAAALVVRAARRDSSAPAAGVVADPAMRELYAQAQRVARSDISLLILGETGTGKEILARQVHALSKRCGGPFVALNCAAFTESLLEAELFGYEKGAFTGAVSSRAGLFEAGSGGTVFLDEVGELPSQVQTRLLRVLENREVIRVGGREPRAIDARFIAATHRDLEADIAAGAFREDLYYRLNGVTLVLPPLRERPSEIAPLAAYFLERATVDQSEPWELTPEALSLMAAHDWPGNVRELRNAIERAVTLFPGPRLLPDYLPDRILKQSRPVRHSVEKDAATVVTASQEPLDLASEVRSLEKNRIVEALNRCHGNQTRAAKMLGMSRRTLVARLTEFNLPRPRKH